jgi:hypothetical protein
MHVTFVSCGKTTAPRYQQNKKQGSISTGFDFLQSGRGQISLLWLNGCGIIKKRVELLQATTETIAGHVAIKEKQLSVLFKLYID